ncbi:MAG TPA: ParB/RepB/Spo0J family partition protein [Kofleriaceae bacterium]
MDEVSPRVTAIELAQLGERLSPLRLRSPEALREMERSLSRHGQLVAVVCHRQDDQVEVVDGFKRLIGARALGWPVLRVEIHEVTGPAAKLLLWQSNARQALSDLEEAWLVRALYRDDRLTQPQIGQLLGRHKSWVCRRLVLAEGLTESVTADIRLGLVSATAAREVGRLPRGNQEQVAQVIARRGLTTRQTTRLVEQLLAASDERGRAAVLAQAERTSAPPAPRPVRAPVTPGEAMIADADALATRATRLHTRLLERPVTSLGVEVERVVVGRLGELQAVLAALCQTLGQVTSTSAAGVSHGA